MPAAAPPGSSIGSHRAGTVWESPRKSVAPAAASQRGVRKVKLTLARLDPWSALKTTFVFGLAGLIVLLVAVSLLYGLIDAMGVLASLRKFLNDVDTSHSGAGVTAWLGFGRIFLISALLGLINVILLTAIVTMGAFIYNVSTDVVGGVDMTFAERS